ncbi:FKBP-type peptidyl-prolyl cis-trans isomerase [Cellulomonas sp. PhB150]|uniref:FKBP-type peptidyl-prolyl cis-trans isomerase n=1 Tax=Cellulomonas sp. PhB150 TaxID=2485188 RepID=UPI000FB504B8|nr:FKBP-type peptidyl-prolyl cis-trans isomerase [Cellulomonas sp. PhB150]ROS30479.1 peptidylprolyl isomerase [Cellulomonas sp. PhB150]
MRRLQGAIALALAGILVLAGCSDEPDLPPDVTVSGEPGEAPTITYLTPLSVSSTYRTQIWPGTGARVVDEKPILVNFWIEDATDASLVKESYSTSPVARFLTEADLGRDLYRTIAGQKAGARMLQVSPGTDQGASSDPTVTVVDVLPVRASGVPVPARSDVPKVTLKANGAPKIKATGEDPPTDLVTRPLIRGTGKQVTATDTITVQYTGFSWKTGEAFDSTWSQGVPVSFSLQDVPTWAEGLVDQPAGSQVMLVVPPTYALGATESKALEGQTVVFVIDILATGTPQGADS